MAKSKSVITNMRFVIDGELADANTHIGELSKNRYKGGKLKKQETERVQWAIKQAKLPEIEDFPVYVTFRWYCKDKRKDLDNIAFAKKYVFDGMVAEGLIPTDGWKHVAGFRDVFEVDRDNPRVEVTIASR